MGNDKGSGLAGWKYMNGKQKRKDSGHKLLNAMLPAPMMMLRRLEGGHLCRPVTCWSLCVEDVPGEQGNWGRALCRGLGEP